MRDLNISSHIPAPLLCVFLLFVPVAGHTQAAGFAGPKPAVTTNLPPAPAPYIPPSQKLRFDNYLFQAIGPYPWLRAGFMAGIHQATHNPPEWREGFPGYGQRYASDFGISLVNATTRYALAEAMHDDVIYYRCSCKKYWARVGHAIISVGIARRGADGHRVFSLPAVVAPYAGPMAAVYGWYPSRYGAKDAFRMGSYGLLAHAGGNITLEFLPTLSRHYPWIAHLHIDDRQAESKPAPAGQ